MLTLLAVFAALAVVVVVAGAVAFVRALADGGDTQGEER